MESEALVTKITQVLQRQDGSEVRIVAETMTGIGLQRSTNVYVHRRLFQQDDWVLCGDKPHPDWRKMSVDEYVKYGRPEMLQVVSPGEILNLAKALGKPMEEFLESNANVTEQIQPGKRHKP